MELFKIQIIWPRLIVIVYKNIYGSSLMQLGRVTNLLLGDDDPYDFYKSIVLHWTNNRYAEG